MNPPLSFPKTLITCVDNNNLQIDNQKTLQISDMQKEMYNSCRLINSVWVLRKTHSTYIIIRSHLKHDTSIELDKQPNIRTK